MFINLPSTFQSYSITFMLNIKVEVPFIVHLDLAFQCCHFLTLPENSKVRKWFCRDITTATYLCQIDKPPYSLPKVTRRHLLDLTSKDINKAQSNSCSYPQKIRMHFPEKHSEMNHKDTGPLLSRCIYHDVN